MIERVRFSPGGFDEYGDPLPSTSTATEIPGAFVAPRMSSDIDDVGRAGVIVGLTLFMPFGYDLDHADEVNVDAVRYRIDGDPGDWENPFTQWEAGASVALVRAEG